MGRPTVKVEFGQGPNVTVGGLTLDDPVLGLLDSGNGLYPASVAGSWVDVTALGPLVRSVSIKRGRQLQLARFNAGTATVVLDNSLSTFEPGNTAGPFVDSGGNSTIRPMVPIRITASVDGVSWLPLWFGFADSWQPSVSAGDDATVTVTGTDGFKVLSQFSSAPLGSGVGASELAGARISRVLSWAGIPSLYEDIDTGSVTVQATTLSQTALVESQLAADTDMGDLFCSAAGKITFRQGNSRTSLPRSQTSQATFSDGSDGWQYEQLVVKNDDSLIKNVAVIGRAGTSVVSTATDSASVAQNLAKTYSRSDLLSTSDGQSAVYASWVVQHQGGGDLADLVRYESITVNPDGINQATLWQTMLEMEIGDRVTVTRTLPGANGRTDSRDCFIEGIQHTIPGGMGNPWTVTLQLSDARSWVPTLYTFTLDDPVKGLLDAGNTLG